MNMFGESEIPNVIVGTSSEQTSDCMYMLLEKEFVLLVNVKIANGCRQIMKSLVGEPRLI